MILVPTELLVSDARRTRAEAEWERLRNARLRARVRVTMDRVHTTVDSSCRLVLERAAVADELAPRLDDGEKPERPLLRLVR